MALLFADGFEKYGAGATSLTNIGLNSEYLAIGVTNTVYGQVSASNAKTGANSLYLSAGYQQAHVRASLKGDKTTIFCETSLKFTTMPIANGRVGVSFYDSSGTLQCLLSVQPDGAVALYRGSSTLLGSSAAGVVPLGQYVNLEIKLVLSQSAGTVEVRKNGVTAPVLTLTGLDNCASALTTAAGVQVGSMTGVSTSDAILYVDDFILWDDSGSSFNSWMGELRVGYHAATADTAQADWTKTGSANGYDCIDEAAQDGDTTYLSAAAAGNISDFDIENMPAGNFSVKAARIIAAHKKTDAGACTFRGGLNQGGTVAGGTTISTSTNYGYSPVGTFYTDPASGVAFTKANIDSVKLRLERVT